MRNQKQWPWHTQENLSEIHYIDFADYAKIILKADNWNQVFQQYFKEKEIISAKFRELEPLEIVSPIQGNFYRGMWRDSNYYVETSCLVLNNDYNAHCEFNGGPEGN